jgi:hypothetical protein
MQPTRSMTCDKSSRKAVDSSDFIFERAGRLKRTLHVATAHCFLEPYRLDISASELHGQIAAWINEGGAGGDADR